MDITKTDALQVVLQEHFDQEIVAEILAARRTQQYKDALLGATNAALSSGAFGAPWIMVQNDAGSKQPFWGSDRFHLIYDFLGLPVQHLALEAKSKI